jgi:hypothetical protein
MIRENLINNLEELFEEVILKTKGVTVEDPINLLTNLRILLRENDVESLIDNHLNKDRLHRVQQECLEKAQELFEEQREKMDELEDKIDKVKETMEIVLKTVVFAENDPLDILIQEDLDNLCESYNDLRKWTDITQRQLELEFDFV